MNQPSLTFHDFLHAMRCNFVPSGFECVVHEATEVLRVFKLVNYTIALMVMLVHHSRSFAQAIHKALKESAIVAAFILAAERWVFVATPAEVVTMANYRAITGQRKRFFCVRQSVPFTHGY